VRKDVLRRLTSRLCPFPHHRTWQRQRLSSMSGKCKSTIVHGLSVNGVAVTSQCDIANVLAASFASASSSDRYDSTFLCIKDIQRHHLFTSTPRILNVIMLHSL
jgi:hypothetical protein